MFECIVVLILTHANIRIGETLQINRMCGQQRTDRGLTEAIEEQNTTDSVVESLQWLPIADSSTHFCLKYSDLFQKQYLLNWVQN